MYQTLLCAFNILAQADLLLTVQYAADFLNAVLIDDRDKYEPELSELCKNFTTFQFFTTVIQNAAGLLTTFDARSEELAKVLQLIVNLAKIRTIRSHVCHAILTANVCGKTAVSTPFKALVRVAALGLDKQPNGMVTVQSVMLLNMLVKVRILYLFLCVYI